MPAELPKVSEIDLGFLISANAVSADENFQKIKDVINEIIDQYGKERLRYSVIVFGDTPSVKVRFNEIYQTEERLKRFVDTLPKPTGAPALDKALEEAKKLFESEARPDAQKILVVIADKKSESDEKEVDRAAEELEEVDVVVISVALHGEADSSELRNITPQVRNLIEANKTMSAKDLAKSIMNKVLRGMLKYAR